MDGTLNRYFISKTNGDFNGFTRHKGFVYGYHNRQAFCTSGIIGTYGLVTVYLQHSNGWYSEELKQTHPLMLAIYKFHSKHLAEKNRKYKWYQAHGLHDEKVVAPCQRKNAAWVDKAAYGVRDAARRKANSERYQGIEHDRVWSN